MKTQAAQPEIIDLAGDDDTAEMMEMVAATEAMEEPAPEPKAVTTELFEMIKRMDNDEEEQDDQGRAEDVMTACERMAQDALGDIGAARETALDSGHATEGVPPVTVIEEVIVVAMDDDEPSWLEAKLGPWVARHRSALRVWLLTLLVVYVSLFVSMLLHDGVRGLSERSLTAAVRDLLWAVLMGIIVLLAIGKHY